MICCDGLSVGRRMVGEWVGGVGWLVGGSMIPRLNRSVGGSIGRSVAVTVGRSVSQSVGERRGMLVKSKINKEMSFAAETLFLLICDLL